MKNLHFLLITLPAQGHINPTLELAKRLISAGAQVSFATTVRGLSQFKTFPSLDGLSYVSFSDGFDNGTDPHDDPHHILSEMERVGTQALTHLIKTLSREGRPVDFLVYGLLLPWVVDVASDLSIPSAFFCTQSAAAFAIYHHFFISHKGIYCKDIKIPPSVVNLQGLPPFAHQDLPSFLLPTSPHASLISTFRQHIQNLEKQPSPCVILNTFDALEEEAIGNIGDHINLVGIGPLVPSDEKSVGCELFEASKPYLQWLNSKANRSVVYVSFGSLAVLQRKQMEEVYHGLVSSGVPFLWVIRSLEEDEQFEKMISELDEEKQGLIVPWCSQMEVLRHQSVGCFVTHCGWNSIMESLVAGVPVVGCPQFSDQMTNAKMVEELWGTGIRATVNEEGIFKREELERCVRIVMGSGGDNKAEKITNNTIKWRQLAFQAVTASSEINIKTFMGTCQN